LLSNAYVTTQVGDLVHHAIRGRSVTGYRGELSVRKVSDEIPEHDTSDTASATRNQDALPAGEKATTKAGDTSGSGVLEAQLFQLRAVTELDELAREHLELMEIALGRQAQDLLDEVGFSSHSPPAIFCASAQRKSRRPARTDAKWASCAADPSSMSLMPGP
jgi:hypothetical protein